MFYHFYIPETEPRLEQVSRNCEEEHLLDPAKTQRIHSRQLTNLRYRLNSKDWAVSEVDVAFSMSLVIRIAEMKPCSRSHDSRPIFCPRNPNVGSEAVGGKVLSIQKRRWQSVHGKPAATGVKVTIGHAINGEND